MFQTHTHTAYARAEYNDNNNNLTPTAKLTVSDIAEMFAIRLEWGLDYQVVTDTTELPHSTSYLQVGV